MELRTKPLNSQQLEAEIAFWVSFLAESGANDVEVAYGWDCDLDIEAMWQYQPVELRKLSEFIGEARAKGILKLGQGDLFIRANGSELVLCHESDIHFTGVDAQLEKIERRWFSLGYVPYGGKGDRFICR